jgi:hypothetical protein
MVKEPKAFSLRGKEPPKHLTTVSHEPRRPPPLVLFRNKLVSLYFCMHALRAHHLELATLAFGITHPLFFLGAHSLAQLQTSCFRVLLKLLVARTPTCSCSCSCSSPTQAAPSAIYTHGIPQAKLHVQASTAHTFYCTITAN